MTCGATIVLREQAVANHVPTSEMTDEQFRTHAMSIFARELGLAAYARFLMTYRSGNGDYTRDRHKWLAGLTLDDILEGMRDRQQPLK